MIGYIVMMVYLIFLTGFYIYLIVYLEKEDKKDIVVMRQLIEEEYQRDIQHVKSQFKSSPCSQ